MKYILIFLTLSAVSFSPVLAGNPKVNKDLIDAAFTGDIARVRIALNSGADVNAIGYANNTPLMGASYNGHVEIVKLLLSRYANVHARDDDGFTPLMMAANKNHTAIVKLLIAKGADVNAKNREGKTALTWASYNLKPETKNILISAGGKTPDSSGQKNKNVRMVTCAKCKGSKGEWISGTTTYSSTGTGNTYSRDRYGNSKVDIQGSTVVRENRSSGSWKECNFCSGQGVVPVNR